MLLSRCSFHTPFDKLAVALPNHTKYSIYDITDVDNKLENYLAAKHPSLSWGLDVAKFLLVTSRSCVLLTAEEVKHDFRHFFFTMHVILRFITILHITYCVFFNEV